MEFIKASWHILEPSNEFSSGWHIEAVCDHLEAISNGDLKRLLINVPPGFMKSLTTNVFFPCWEWTRNPSLRYVCSSYSNKLTIRDNVKARYILESDWYQRHWGSIIDQNENNKEKFATKQRGFKLATSIGGATTGERGDRFIFDDPHNVAEGESDAKIHEASTYWREVAPTRLNSAVDSAMLVIMQRVSERDISSIIIEEELDTFTHLCLPMEYDPSRKCITEFKNFKFEDPRKKEGELLWEERFPRVSVERDKRKLGAYATAGQFQQTPIPRGDGLFKVENIKIVNGYPESIVSTVRGWDIAATDGNSKKGQKAAYTAGVKLGITKDGRLYVMDVKRFKKDPGQMQEEIRKTAVEDGLSVLQSIPQDPGASGKALKYSFLDILHGYPVHFSPESGSKETRALPIASQIEGGNLYMVKAHWNGAFMDELITFPVGKFKDQVDGLTRAYTKLISNRKKNDKIIGPSLIT